jgi:5-methylcytosine-specific restriction endonuclease McrA
MEEYLAFRNFRHFERTRSDIRLPLDLLDDRRFRELPDAQKAHLICLLLLAARSGNALPNRPAKLSYLIGATEPLNVRDLSEFIEIALADGLASEDRIARRRIPDDLRAAVLVRDDGRCRICRSARNPEIDHIIPVSKGGVTEENNLQTLCRHCNRRKWKKMIPRL